MKQFRAMIVVIALVLSACSGDVATDTAPTPSTSVTDTAAPTPTAGLVETTTTTQEPTTTTTVAPVLEASVSPQLRRIQATMAETAKVQSARMSSEITMYSPNDFDGDIKFTFTAAFDQKTGSSSFGIDLSEMLEFAQSEIIADTGDTQGDQIGAAFAQIFLAMFTKFEVRQIGDTMYVNNPAFVSMSGAETPWIAGPAEPGSDPAKQFLQDSPSNPADILDPLRNGRGTVVEIGPETVRGVETTHYQITYDRDSLLESAPAGDTSQFADDLAAFGDEVLVDVWMDDDYVYKVMFDIDGADAVDPEADSFERVVMVYEIYDYNSDVLIEAPPLDQVTFVEDAGTFGFGFGDD